MTATGTPPEENGERCTPEPDGDSSGAVQPYEVGTYADLKRRSVTGDGLEIHHVPQSHPAGQAIKNYDRKSAPSIAIPKDEHYLIDNLKGIYSGSGSDLADRDLQQLRAKTNAPSESIERLRNLIKKTYPDVC